MARALKPLADTHAPTMRHPFHGHHAVHVAAQDSNRLHLLHHPPWPRLQLATGEQSKTLHAFLQACTRATRRIHLLLSPSATAPREPVPSSGAPADQRLPEPSPRAAPQAIPASSRAHSTRTARRNQTHRPGQSVPSSTAPPPHRRSDRHSHQWPRWPGCRPCGSACLEASVRETGSRAVAETLAARTRRAATPAMPASTRTSSSASAGRVAGRRRRTGATRPSSTAVSPDPPLL